MRCVIGVIGESTSEIGHALRCGKPVVGLRTSEAQRGGERAPLTVVGTAEEAVPATLPLAAS